MADIYWFNTKKPPTMKKEALTLLATEDYFEAIKSFTLSLCIICSLKV